MIISLITDFGNSDYFAGVMKGVILSICPDVSIVDISHEIKPYSITEAGFVLSKSYNYFPDKSVHLIVVDPGVGSSRKILIAESTAHFFVMPDNGIISWILKDDNNINVYELTDTKIYTKSPSATFHGRDIMAPVAAKLASGGKPEDLGRLTTDYIKAIIPEARCNENKITGEIIYCDHFGNLITNIRKEDYENKVKSKKSPQILIKLNNIEVGKISSCYSDGTNSDINALWGSHGNLELFVKGGDAEKLSGMKSGTKVEITFR